MSRADDYADKYADLWNEAYRFALTQIPCGAAKFADALMRQAQRLIIEANVRPASSAPEAGPIRAPTSATK